MSRLLALVVGELIPRGGFRSDPRTPHLIVMNQETGKTIALDLAAQSNYNWYHLPDAPLHLLDGPGPLTAADELRARRREARAIGDPVPVSLNDLQDDEMTPLHDERDLTADTSKDHISIPGETPEQAEQRRNLIRKSMVRGSRFDPDLKPRDLESDIAEDRH